MSATRGVYGKIYQEIAGLALGGDASFYKAEAEAQVSRALGRGVVCLLHHFLVYDVDLVRLHKVSVPGSALGLAMGFRTGNDEVLRSISVGWSDEREEL